MNDEELADAVVATGLIGKTESGLYYLNPRSDGCEPSDIVNDWRVAGMLLEGMSEFEPCCLWIDTGVRFARKGPWYSTITKARTRFGDADGFPRAIIEAFVSDLRDQDR